jgi:hypothetical protein
MRAIMVVLLSVSLAGSLCGCLTTIPEGSRKNYLSYYLPRDRTGRQAQPVTDAQVQDFVRERWLDPIAGGWK